jgi:hypothetical protein
MPCPSEPQKPKPTCGCKWVDFIDYSPSYFDAPFVASWLWDGNRPVHEWMRWYKFAEHPPHDPIIVNQPSNGSNSQYDLFRIMTQINAYDRKC